MGKLQTESKTVQFLGDAFVSVLRQIRSGYDQRPQHFPQSIILCGIRDVRDYRAQENIIYRRDTHIDILIDKLREERVRCVIGPILSGDRKHLIAF